MSNSVDRFPVDLDLAWKWIGYAQKQNALGTLHSRFVVDIDYIMLEHKLGTLASPRQKAKYMLTVECFKMLGMMANTDKGTEIRKYFLKCEEIAKTNKLTKANGFSTDIDNLYELWQGTGIATTAQLAEYFEISFDAVESVIRRHKEELQSDGLQVLSGKALKDVSAKLTETSKAPSLTIWTPRAAVRLGMLLRDSQVAKQLRTIVLNIVEGANPIKPIEVAELSTDFDNLYDLVRDKSREANWLINQVEDRLDRKIEIYTSATEINCNRNLERSIGSLDRKIDITNRRIDLVEQRSIDITQALLAQIEAAGQRLLAKIDASSSNIPPSTVSVEPLTTQFALSRLVRGYAIERELDYSHCWTRLHTEFRDRYHIDLPKRGKNHTPKLSGAEYAQRTGHIDRLYALATELFGSPH